MMNKNNINTAGPLRRFASATIDLIVVISIWITLVGGIVLYQGHAIAPGTWWLTPILPLIIFLYFTLLWTRGQTIGMMVYHLVIVDRKHLPVTFKNAIIRLLLQSVSFFIIDLLVTFVRKNHDSTIDSILKIRLIRSLNEHATS